MTKRNWVIRLKNMQLIEARDVVMTDASVEVIKQLVNPGNPASITLRQIDEYVYACGLQLVTEQVKSIRLQARRDGLSNVSFADADAVTKQTLIATLREGGYLDVADQLEKAGA